jgi:hypothetical protein
VGLIREGFPAFDAAGFGCVYRGNSGYFGRNFFPMKKLLVLLAGLAALTLTASAQNFEGTITWGLKYTMSDEMSQPMQGAQSMMNDPAMLAQMQAAMNDPQMKAMMAANPQMKAMMDNMSKGGGMGAGGMMDSMVPKSVSMKIKGNSSLSIIEGGMTAGEILTPSDKNLAYLIDRPSRTYTTMNQGTAAAVAPAGKFKISKTSETTKILGYTCTKTVVEETSGRGPATSYTIWSTTEIAGANSKQFAQLKLSEGGDTSFMSAIDGVPLRMEIAAPEMKMTMEATGVKRESLPDSLFALPAGFTERKLPGR